MILRATALALAGLALCLPFFRGGTPFPAELTEHAGAMLLFFAGALVVAFAPGLLRVADGAGALIFASARRRFNVSLFLATAGVGSAVSLLLFQGLPYLDDGVSALFQARIFARGALTLPLPPDAGFYELFCVIGAKAGTGRWSTMYPPGWPALLLPGVLLGASWLVNPLLAGGLAVAAAELGRELFGDKAGRIAGLLALTSPLLVMLSGTHLSHTATALCCTVCLWALLRFQRNGSARYGLAAGAAWGAALLCRPVDALLLGALFALIPLSTPRATLSRWRGIVAALTVALAAAAVLAAFQEVVTGDPLTPGHKVGMGNFGSFGFIRLQGEKWHTPEKAVDYTLRRFEVLNGRLAGWPVPLFLIAALPFLLSKPTGHGVLLLASPFPLAVVFAFFWYFEMYLPARYLSASAPLLLVLAAQGLALLHDAAARAGDHHARVVAAWGAASLLFALGVVTPSEARQVRRRAGDVEHTLPRVLQANGIRNAVVFMDAVSPGIQEEERLNDFFATGFLRNELDLDGDIVFARNSREQNHRLMAAHPGRSYYLYRYHRDSRRAYLYRYAASESQYCLEPVPAADPAIMLYDAAAAGARFGCIPVPETR